MSAASTVDSSPNSAPKLTLDSIPAAVKLHISQVLARTLVGVVGYKGKKYGEDELIGSGTLVKLGHTYGILTADHVWGYLQGTEGNYGFHKMGLLTGSVERTLLFPRLISVPYITPAAITVARDPAKGSGVGPDLAFISIVPELAQQIEAEDGGHFYDLGVGYAHWQQNRLRAEEGIWCINGFLGEETKWELIDGSSEDEPLYQPATQSLGMFSGSDQGMYVEGEFDYFHVGVAVTSPATFKNISGGGAWFVPLILNEDGTVATDLVLQEAFLGGVVFAQNSVAGVVHSLRSHGWDSLYTHVLAAIQRVPRWVAIVSSSK